MIWSPSLNRMAVCLTLAFSNFHRIILLYSNLWSRVGKTAAQLLQIHLPFGTLVMPTHCIWYHILPTHWPSLWHIIMVLSVFTSPQQHSFSRGSSSTWSRCGGWNASPIMVSIMLTLYASCSSSESGKSMGRWSKLSVPITAIAAPVT